MLMSVLSDSRTVFIWAMAFFLPAGFVLFDISLFFRIKCDTYDIFSEDGIERIVKGRSLYKTTWDNIAKISYRSSWLWFPLVAAAALIVQDVIPDSPHVLRLEYKNVVWSTDSTGKKVEYNALRPDNKYYMFTHIGKRNLKRIIRFFPSDAVICLPKSIYPSNSRA